MSSGDFPEAGDIEALRPELSAEEACLAALFDLRDAQEFSRGMLVSDFYKEMYVTDMPPYDLRTRLSIQRIDTNEERSPFMERSTRVEGAEVVATLVVDLDSDKADFRQMLNFDFVRTDDGIGLFRKEWFFEDDERLPRYTYRGR